MFSNEPILNNIIELHEKKIFLFGWMKIVIAILVIGLLVSVSYAWVVLPVGLGLGLASRHYSETFKNKESLPKDEMIQNIRFGESIFRMTVSTSAVFSFVCMFPFFFDSGNDTHNAQSNISQSQSFPSSSPKESSKLNSGPAGQIEHL